MKTSFDPLAQRYPSQRFPLYARGGMVNCSSPQAAAAGLEALRRGGNAMDAAVETLLGQIRRNKTRLSRQLRDSTLDLATVEDGEDEGE